MIRVTIFKRSNVYQGFKLYGHAGYDEYGKDIVCAAVSALTINTINSIDSLTQDIFTVKEDENAGLIDFKFKDMPSEGSNLLMDSYVLGLKTIFEDNKRYIKLDFKEE